MHKKCQKIPGLKTNLNSGNKSCRAFLLQDRLESAHEVLPRAGRYSSCPCKAKVDRLVAPSRCKSAVHLVHIGKLFMVAAECTAVKADTFQH